ncbi:MAG: glycosyltransferase family 2 protein [Anaerolineae bacterium]|nr:glycosyltransferase family 2 protein [Anaerolineae bacterium]
MPKKTQPNGLALIPAHNEEAHIGAVAEAAKQHLAVLVVDDGSSDGTAQAAEAAGASVTRHEANQGKGAALRSGFRAALEQGCDFVITLDADGQHDPAEMPAFLEAFEVTQADLIIGRRDFRQMPFIRRLSNTLGTVLFSWAVGRRIPDNQSGYRLIGRRLLETEAVLQSAEAGFEFEVEMIALAIKEGLNIAWVPIKTIYRDEKSHIQPWKHLKKFILVSLRSGDMTKK